MIQAICEALYQIGAALCAGLGLLAVVFIILFIIRRLFRIASYLFGSEAGQTADEDSDEETSTIFVYISTPINGREGASFQEKFVAARNRVDEIEKGIFTCEVFDRPCVVISTFDESDGSESEASAMGRCIYDVIDCDIVIIDDSDPDALARSKGCRLELEAARLYKKNIVKTSEYGI